MSSKVQTVELPSVSDISVCSSLHEQLSASLASGKGCMVNAKAVQKVATPCIQLVVAAGLQAERQSVVFALNDPSDVFAEALKMLGLAEYLERWGKKK